MFLVVLLFTVTYILEARLTLMPLPNKERPTRVEKMAELKLS
jgi:hypothetical protein